MQVFVRDGGEQERAAKRALKDKMKEMRTTNAGKMQELKSMKRAFKSWRHRNRGSELDSSYKKALDIGDDAKRQEALAALMQQWTDTHSKGTSSGSNTYSHASTLEARKRTQNTDMDYVACCILQLENGRP